MSTLQYSGRPIFALLRGDLPEIVVHGTVFVKQEGKDATGSDSAVPIIARSLLKPWQFLASQVADFSQPFWIMGVSSHGSQPAQLEMLNAMAKFLELSDDNLYCPRVFPLDPLISSQMKLAGHNPSRMHHPCSGKHLVMLAACKKHGFPLQTYCQEDHPLQKRLFNLVGSQAGEKHRWLTDSCGVPTLAASARVHLNMWERLAQQSDPDAVALKENWILHPRLTGGTKRLDSDIMEFGKGRLIAKEGADGLLIVQSLPGSGEPAASCLIKVSSGYNSAYLALALWSIVSTQPMPTIFTQLAEYLRSRMEEWVPRDQNYLNLLT
jgi:L-asparaginase